MDPAGRVDYQRRFGIGVSLVVREEVENALDVVGRVEAWRDGCDGVGPELSFRGREGRMAERRRQVWYGDVRQGDNSRRRIFRLPRVDIEGHHARPGPVLGASPIGYEAVCQEPTKS